MAAKDRVVLVISHTHWDREWYESFQSFRYRLVKAIDRLIEILQENADYGCFNLDGQVVVLEDYLEIRPEMRPVLQRLVKSRKIGIGPWYVQTDEFLSDGEALIRNLLLGAQLAEEFGEVQRLAYLPDTFGHNSQMPQIARQFGISSSLIWRGVSGDDWPWEFIWKGADGSCLYTYRLPERQGYCNMAFTPEGKPIDSAFFIGSATEFMKNSLTGLVVLMDGCDHVQPDGSILPLIDFLAGAEDSLSCRQVLFNDLSEELERRIPLCEGIEVLRGELRGVNTSRRGYFNFILPNVLSSRCNNKRENFDTLNWLESYAEPLASLAWLNGKKYPSGFLREAWKLLLQNLAHDSIGGCSIDEVHLDMSRRYSHSVEIARNVAFDSLAALCSVTPEGSDGSFVVFNSSQYSRDEIEIHLDLPAMVIGNPPRRPVMIDEKGEEVEFQISSMNEVVKALNYLGKSAPIEKVVSVKFYIKSKIEGLSFKRFYISPSEMPVSHSHSGTDNSLRLENEHMSVNVLPDGTIEVLNRVTGEKLFTNLFEDGGDCGDGYVYSKPLFDTLVTSSGCLKAIEVIENGPLEKAIRLRYSLPVPAGLSENGRKRSYDRKEMPIQCILKLIKTNGVLEIETEIENNCENHRVQVNFWSERPGKALFYKTPFDIVKAAKDEISRFNPNWIEDEPVARPNNGLFGEIESIDNFKGFAVSARGINEFEGSVHGLRLTLFRAVGHIASPYPLSNMKRPAGPKIETPGAQMKGRLFFNYSVFFIDSLEEALKKSSLYLKKPLALAFTGRLPEAPLTVDSSTTEITAMKKSESRESFILRLANLSTEKDRVEIRLREGLFGKAFLCTANEKRSGEVPIENGVVCIACGPKKVVTLELEVNGRLTLSDWQE